MLRDPIHRSPSSHLKLPASVIIIHIYRISPPPHSQTLWYYASCILCTIRCWSALIKCLSHAHWKRALMFGAFKYSNRISSFDLWPCILGSVHKCISNECCCEHEPRFIQISMQWIIECDGSGVPSWVIFLFIH